MLGALESGLVARRGSGAAEMDIAAVAVHGGVEVLIGEVELEAELLEIETDGARWPVVHSTLMPADLISRIPGFERFIGLPAGSMALAARIGSFGCIAQFRARPVAVPFRPGFV